MKYKILFQKTETDLEHVVTNHMKMGWELAGGLSVVRYSNYELFYQAVFLIPAP